MWSNTQTWFETSSSHEKDMYPSHRLKYECLESYCLPAHSLSAPRQTISNYRDSHDVSVHSRSLPVPTISEYWNSYGVQAHIRSPPRPNVSNYWNSQDVLAHSRGSLIPTISDYRDSYDVPTHSRALPISNYWEYCSPSMRPIKSYRYQHWYSSIEKTPILVQSKRHYWYRNNHAETRYRLRHSIKIPDKASGHGTLQSEMTKKPPCRKITQHFPPYPLQELQAARNTLIDELYSVREGIILFRVRKAAGIFKDPSYKTENEFSVSYDHQASFLLTVPLPCPTKVVPEID